MGGGNDRDRKAHGPKQRGVTARLKNERQFKINGHAIKAKLALPKSGSVTGRQTPGTSKKQEERGATLWKQPETRWQVPGGAQAGDTEVSARKREWRQTPRKEVLAE